MFGTCIEATTKQQWGYGMSKMDVVVLRDDAMVD